MATKTQYADAVASIIKTEMEARAMVEALGFNPSRIAFQPRMDMTLWSIAEEAEKRSVSLEKFTTAAATVQRVIANKPTAELIARIEALCSAWPKDSRMPGADVLAAIVGGTAEQVRSIMGTLAEE